MDPSTRYLNTIIQLQKDCSSSTLFFNNGYNLYLECLPG